MSELVSAARYGRTKDVIRYLANTCVDDVSQDSTALMQAVNENRPKIVKILLEHGADVNFKNDAGFTVIHWLVNAETFNPDILASLGGVDFDVQPNLLKTIVESRREPVIIIKSLIDAGYQYSREALIDILSSSNREAVAEFLNHITLEDLSIDLTGYPLRVLIESRKIELEKSLLSEKIKTDKKTGTHKL